MKRIFNWWVVTLLTAVVVTAILAFGLPIFLRFLRPWWVRLLIIVVVFSVWGVFALLRVLRARSASDAIAKELAQPAPGDAEVQAVAKRMAEALAGFRKASGSKRDYLYSRPWYMIIGPPGAGKTTALIHSGLRFPYADTALKGVGGTRNLDFWFADEAALVDTAGRYTTQDSDAPADAAAWQGFLRLLRKHRPLQPINGVLVAIGLDELLKSDRLQIDGHAAAVRRRLAELRQTLEVLAPVYVLFTKADLLAGFSEFYEDLDVEGRRAVVGGTLSREQTLDAAYLTSEFDVFAQSVADRAAKRLQEDPDARRRALILGFPAQIDALRARALRFLDGVFLQDAEAVGELRGFYLTSGVQGGAPLDRLLSGVASVYDQAPAATQGQGRAYFLNRLLNEVIFPEAGLVQDDPRARARRGLMLSGGLAAIAAVALLTLVLWAISFTDNRGLQTKLFAGAQGAGNEIRSTGIDLVEVKASDPDLEQSLSVLRALRGLPGGYADQKKGSRPIFGTFGLYQDGHANTAKEAYLTALQRILAPRILLRLERYMADHKAEPLALYDALKVYLMLGGQGPFDAKTVSSWIKSDWAANAFPGADRENVRQELGEHLDAMLERGQPSAIWPEHNAPLDGDLIATSRQTVEQLSMSERAYAILRQKGEADGDPWRAGEVLASGDAKAFAAGPAALQLSVPYFFTKAGYQKSYLIGLQTVEEDLRRDSWVLGADANTAGLRSQMSDVRSGVAADYARDYIAAWEGVIKALQPADYFHDPAAFGAFTHTPSPLKLILLEVRKNTMFGAGSHPTAAMETAALAKIPGGKMFAGSSAGGGVDAGQQITGNFKPLNDYVGDGKAPAPIDDFVTGIKTAGAASAGAAVAGGGMGGAALQGQLATAVGSMAATSASAPPILQGFVAAAVQGGKTAQVSSAKGAVADAYKRDLQPLCQAATDNRYPFAGASLNDASVTDMLRVFGTGGAFEAFSRDRLGTLLNKVGPVWRWSVDEPVGASLDPLAAEDFHKADEIHDLLTAGLPIQVEGAGFGGAVTAVEFSSGGTTYRFDAGAVGARPIMWSASTLPEAHVTLFSGAKVIRTYAAQGPWALFHLIDKARQENAGPTAFKATFGEGAAFATLKMGLTSDKNPFRRGSLWSLRCPASL